MYIFTVDIPGTGMQLHGGILWKDTTVCKVCKDTFPIGTILSLVCRCICNLGMYSLVYLILYPDVTIERITYI